MDKTLIEGLSANTWEGKPMTHEQMLGIAADVAEYVLECSYDGYPYVTQQNGDVTYTDEAQDLFNDHFDVVFSMIEDNNEGLTQ